MMAPSRKRSDDSSSPQLDSAGVVKKRAKCPDFTLEDKERIANTVLYLAPRYIAKSNRRGRKKSGELPLSSRPMYARVKVMLGLEHQVDSLLHCFKSWLKKNGDTWEQMREQAQGNEDAYFADLIQLESDLINEGVLDAEDESLQGDFHLLNDDQLNEFNDAEEATGDGWDIESQNVETGSNDFDREMEDSLLDSPKLKQEQVDEGLAAAASPLLHDNVNDANAPTQVHPQPTIAEDSVGVNETGTGGEEPQAGHAGAEADGSSAGAGERAAGPSRPTDSTRPQLNFYFYAPINIYVQNRGGGGGGGSSGSQGDNGDGGGTSANNGS